MTVVTSAPSSLPTMAGGGTIEQRRSRTRVTNFVPSSYDELFRHYYPYVCKQVQKFGISAEHADDVAMTILEKFIKKDRIREFDATYTSKHDGTVRAASFPTYLSAIVELYVRHFRDRLQIHAAREGFSVDTPVFSGPSGTVTWLDLNGPSFYENFDELSELDFVTQIRQRLAVTVPRNAQDRCDLPKFFEAVLVHANNYGRVDLAELATEFGVSKTSIQNWMLRLRTEVGFVIDGD